MQSSAVGNNEGTEVISNATDMELENIQNFEGKYPKQIWSLFFSEM